MKSRKRNKNLKRLQLYRGLDHIANFLNSLDTEGMSIKELRSAIYKECLDPTIL